jgi:TolB protein
VRINRNSLLALLTLLSVFYCRADAKGPASKPDYTVAFASFAPLNTDIFVAEADGSNPRPLLARQGLDQNASFSRDGKWVVFTSERNGSADIYRVHPNGSGLERLTDNPAFDDQGTLSPDGRFLAFVSSRTGQADLWVLELATKKLRNLTNNPAGDFRPSWSPDGRWIAFSSDRDSNKPKFTFVTLHSTEIYLIRADGSGLRRVTHAQSFGGSPVWSPDGGRLLFYEAEIKEVHAITRPLRQRGTTQIATVDLRTDERRVLTSGAGEKWSPRWLAQGGVAYVSGGPAGGVEFTDGPVVGARGEFNSPSWSVDGRHMVFHREVDHNWPPLQEWHSRERQFRLTRTGVLPSSSPDGDRLLCNDRTAGILHNSILLMNADGSQRSVLFTDPEKSALGPVWSPRGDAIAFGIGGFFQGSLGAAVADIAVMGADGAGLKILTDGSGNYGFPSWSPDGRQLVYRTSGEGKNGLSIIDVWTGKVRALTGDSGNGNFPSWSPLGDRISFTSNRDGDYEIYTMKTDGTDLRRLTHSPGNDAHNNWSPDGKWIVFASNRGGFKDEAVLHPFNPQPSGDIYVMRADGSDVRLLTDNQYEEGTPNWIPLRREKTTKGNKQSPNLNTKTPLNAKIP